MNKCDDFKINKQIIIGIFIAPILLGGKDSYTVFSGEGVPNLESAFHLRDVHVEQLGQDIMVEGYKEL